MPDNVRVSASLAAFKIALKTVRLDNKCCSSCDQCKILKLPVHTCTFFLSIIFNFYLISLLCIYLFISPIDVLSLFYRFTFVGDISNFVINKFEVK